MTKEEEDANYKKLEIALTQLNLMHDLTIKQRELKRQIEEFLRSVEGNYND